MAGHSEPAHSPTSAHLDRAEDAAQRAAVDLHGRPLLAPQVLLQHSRRQGGGPLFRHSLLSAKLGTSGEELHTGPGCADLQGAARAPGTQLNRPTTADVVCSDQHGAAPKLTLTSFSTVASLAVGLLGAAAPWSPEEGPAAAAAAPCCPSSIRLMAC